MQFSDFYSEVGEWKISTYRAAVHGVTESDTTEQLSNNPLTNHKERERVLLLRHRGTVFR